MPKINKNEMETVLENSTQTRQSHEHAKPFVSAPNNKTNYVYSTGEISNKLGEIATGETDIFEEIKKKGYVKNVSEIPAKKHKNGNLCKIAIVAPVSAGKSTLLNALCEYPILPVASGTTSSTVTYITRANTHKEESVSVFSLVRETVTSGKVSVPRFKPAATGKTFYANNISKAMFDKLLQYARLVMKGDGNKHITTIENLVYFMRSTEAVDIGFGGTDSEKRNIPDSEFALDYEIERHRFVLLLVLLCLYVKQNEENAALGPYKKEVNKQRTALMRELGLKVDEDYCVNLKWCSNSIPEDATLIDLPGTGADVKQKGSQSSHTMLVTGVLEDADALWVLCSDNGIIDRDLMEALNDDIQLHPEKSKVCIYNCKNGNPNDSTPVKEFIEKIRSLAGERCYVVDALAGEYKFTQNLVSVEKTRKANTLRNTMRQLGMPINDYRQCAEILANDYTQKFCPTYETIDRGSYVETVQNTEISYSLEQFFRSALTDYVARLKLDVVAKESTDQLNFFGVVKTELLQSIDLMEKSKGKGKEIADAIVTALEVSNSLALNKIYDVQHNCHIQLEDKIKTTRLTAAARINKAFGNNYRSLIQNIHFQWRRLTTPGDRLCLEENFWGNYVLNEANKNKFDTVAMNVRNAIAPNCFSKAFCVTDTIVEEYEGIFREYIADLKKVAYNYMSDYLKTFSKEYDRQRDKYCFEYNENGELVKENRDLFAQFETVKKDLEPAIGQRVNTLYELLCRRYEHVLDSDSVFRAIVKETEDTFKKLFTTAVLGRLRDEIYKKYENIVKVRWRRDKIEIDKLNDILRNDFKDIESECQEDITGIVDGLYGDNLDSKVDGTNFNAAVSLFANRENAAISSFSDEKIEISHQSIKDLVSLSANIAVDVERIIKDMEEKLASWCKLEPAFSVIGEHIYKCSKDAYYPQYSKKLDEYNICKGKN